MLDGVKRGDALELSPLLALGGGGSSFSHTVLISQRRPRCGCVKAAGVPTFSPSQFRSCAPCNPRLHLCHLAHPCLLFVHLSAVPSPPLGFGASFLCCRKTHVSGKQWSSCHFCFSPPPPLPRAIVADPTFVCVLRLLLKIKNSPFHPLYCFLVGCPCHSFSFMSSLDI